MSSKQKSIIRVSVSAVLFSAIAFTQELDITKGFDAVVSGFVSAFSSDLTAAVNIFITSLASPLLMVLYCSALMLLPKTRMLIGLPIAIAMIIQVLINSTLKSVFMRARPEFGALVIEYGYSFPSGHAMASMVLATCLKILLTSEKPNLQALSNVLWIFPLIIGLSRVYLGVHFASDVLAGWAAGYCVAYLSLSALNKIKAYAASKRSGSN